MKNLRLFAYPNVSPSLLAADHSHIEEEILKARAAGCSYIHIDVMDGVFVQNHSFGVGFVRDIAHTHPLVNDVHIMIEKPELHYRDYCLSGADVLTFHFEATDEKNILPTLRGIRSMGVHPGLSIKPLTPVEAIYPYLGKTDLILVMSVEPGKGGQSFIEDSLEKIKKLRDKIDALPLNTRPILEVDGGINDVTGPKCLAAGADLLVAGSYLYGHEDFAARVRSLLK